jgi:valyl-tRNA synthetase
MIMMGIKFMGDVPFRDVYIHALVRDAEGKKMSKSKGNVVDPLTIIDQFGTDAFRFTLTMLAAQGRDVLLSEERIEGSRNFVNKIWNASKLSFILVGDEKPSTTVARPSFLPDRWIRSRMQKVIKEVKASIEEYRFNDTANTLYAFVWHEFCDWYLEVIKPNLYGKVDTFDNAATRATLYRTLEDILKLLHPIMPFVTEEIYQRLPGHETESIMISPFPVFDELKVDEESEVQMETIMGVIDVIRNIRGETGIAPHVKLETIIRAGGQESLLKSYEYYIKELAKVENIFFVDGAAPEHAAVGVYKEIEVFVPLKNVIDVTKELSRIEKEIGKIDEESEKISRKLSNESFREKAPAEVIAKNEAVFAELKAKREKLEASKKVLEEI